MEDIEVIALIMAALGQAAFCTTILLSRSFRTQAYLPLGVFFIASGIVMAGPAIATFLPVWRTHFIAMALPAYLLMGPALWLYVEGLTSETAWRLQPRHGWHVIPFGLGLIATGAVIGLPADIRNKVLIEGDLPDQLYLEILFLCVFLLILGWIIQSGFYVIAALRQLTRYRQRLKALFTSNEQRELHWLVWLVLVIGGVWLVSFAHIIADNFFGRPLISDRFGSAMALVLVWSLGLWGLRQKPGFEGRYLDDPLDVEEAVPPDLTASRKYQRSALGNEQARRIAEKIDAAMTHDQLYLDPDLSLHKLANHVAISPNYITQTLNQTIGESFFDYVNRWRINAAKPQIIAADRTIIAVALGVGFNARSSFYKAFRRETGQTPSEYRKKHV